VADESVNTPAKLSESIAAAPASLCVGAATLPLFTMDLSPITSPPQKKKKNHPRGQRFFQVKERARRARINRHIYEEGFGTEDCSCTNELVNDLEGWFERRLIPPLPLDGPLYVHM
jgi:hypothetical protein